MTKLIIMSTSLGSTLILAVFKSEQQYPVKLVLYYQRLLVNLYKF